MAANYNNNIRRMPVVKTVFLGDQSVGKSNLIRSYLGYEFDEYLYSNIGSDRFDKKINFEDKDYKILIFDTPGQERFRHTIRWVLRNINIIILVFDMTRKKSFLELDIFLEYIQENSSNFDNLTFLLIGNKADLSDKWEIKEKDAKKFAEIMKSKFFLSSAKNKPGELKQFLDEFFLEYINKYKLELENPQNAQRVQRIQNLNNRPNRRRNNCA